MTAEEIALRLERCARAAEHMRAALVLLDEAGAEQAAALLDHALHTIPGVPWDGGDLGDDLSGAMDDDPPAG